MSINTVGDYYLRADELKLNQCYLCGAKKRSKWELDVHIRGVHAEGEGKKSYLDGMIIKVKAFEYEVH